MTRFNALLTAGCLAFTASVAMGAPCDKQKTANSCNGATKTKLASMKEGTSCSAKTATLASNTANSCSGSKTATMASNPASSCMSSKMAANSCNGSKTATLASNPASSCMSSKMAANSCNGSKMATLASNPGDRSSCGSSKTAALASMTTYGPDIVDTAVSAGSFNTLAAALGAADLVGALKSDGPFTVFAPTDEAFAKLPRGTVDELLKPENKGLLTAILTYHVVPGNVMAKDVVTLTSASTLNGQRIDISVSKKGVMVDGANVVKTDIGCRNGVIHVIDRVIMPSTDNLIETAVKAGSFETLAAAVKAAGLAGVLSGTDAYTVFAPTDAAFAKLPAGTVESLLEPGQRQTLVDILKYHVVPGRVYARDALYAETAETAQGSRLRFALAGNLRVNDANVINADLETTNGVIHVIDEVLIP